MEGRWTPLTNDMTTGRPLPLLVKFAIPLTLGNILQQLYNVADSVIAGQFIGVDALAAIGSAGPLMFMVTGWLNGLTSGFAVLLSQSFGAGKKEELRRYAALSVTISFVVTVVLTAILLAANRTILGWMNVPQELMGQTWRYTEVIYGGLLATCAYNALSAALRALGDGKTPLYFLLLASVLNVALDIIFIVSFGMDVEGCAWATVIAQGLSVLLCMIRMVKDGGAATIHFKELRFNGSMIRQVITQGLPTGLQNSVISVGNLVVQSNINTFGAFAISGQGAFAKLEGIAFLPIMSMSMALTTFVSQNLGAGKADRAKKGSVMGVAFGMAMAELVGICLFIWVPILLRIFVDVPEAIEFGTIHGRTVALFFFLLAFSNCATGVLRGVGKSIVPMFTMLICWCGIRVLYVTIAIRIIPVFRTISSAYPLTWTLSSIIFIVFLLRMDWDARV